LQVGTATKVMTGAPVPLNATKVVPHELTIENDGMITVTQMPAISNICLCGEDKRCGELILKAPVYLGPLEIANLVASGLTEIKVFKKLKVVIISTGNEIVDQFHEINLGKIMNSNGPMLYNLCQQYGLEVMDDLLLKDDYQLTFEHLRRALMKADIVIFSGGVSVGDFDFVSRVLNTKDLKLHFNQVAIKPGKPITFATMNNKMIFGLPGNPISLYLTFHLFVLRAIKKILGFIEKKYLYPLQDQFHRKNNERTEYIPGKLQDGIIIPIAIHGSAHLQALLSADGFFMVPTGVMTIPAGQKTEFIPLRMADLC